MIRGNPKAVRDMVRRKIKGTRAKRLVSPSSEPDFYRLPFAHHPEVNIKQREISHPKVVTNNHQAIQNVSLAPSTGEWLDDLEPIPITSTEGGMFENFACSAIDTSLDLEPSPLSLVREVSLDENS